MKKIWKFKLPKHFEIDLRKYSIHIKDCVFLDSSSGETVTAGFADNGILVIFKGYEWDGCTPKFKLFGRIFGTPDFKGTYIPSLVHDFLIEFCSQHSLNRKEIDCIFEQILRENKFKIGWMYYVGVHAFRPIAVRIGVCR